LDLLHVTVVGWMFSKATCHETSPHCLTPAVSPDFGLTARWFWIEGEQQ
jgi:hypothetical protein